VSTRFRFLWWWWFELWFSGLLYIPCSLVLGCLRNI